MSHFKRDIKIDNTRKNHIFEIVFIETNREKEGERKTEINVEINQTPLMWFRVSPIIFLATPSASHDHDITAVRSLIKVLK